MAYGEKLSWVVQYLGTTFLSNHSFDVYALRDIINMTSQKYIEVNRETSHAPFYIDKMANENGGLLVLNFYTFYRYFPKGIN